SALNPDSSAMRFDERLRNGQAQPEAAVLAPTTLPEPVEDLFQVGRPYPWTVVLHMKQHLRPVANDVECHAASRRHELDRVAKQIAKDLRNTHGVGANSDVRIGPHHLEHNVSFGSGVPERSQRLLRDLVRTHRLEVKRQATCLETDRVEE